MKKFTRLEPVEHDVKFLGFNVYADASDITLNEESDIEKFIQFNESENRLECIIDLDTGYVVGFNGDLQSQVDIFDKCVDDGTYALYDDEMNIITEYEGYVPNILEVNENGYGDYLNFTINPDGTIKNWKNHVNALGCTIFDEWDSENNDD